jgi:uncharacterized protein YkwD
MKSSSVAWVALAATLVSCRPAAKRAEFASGLPTVEASSQEQSIEREMFDRLNVDRKQRGLPPLSYDDRLAEVARYHSQDMRDAGFFGHDSPSTGSPQDRIDKAGYLAAESRENVALAPDVTTAQDQLIASPGHYANIVATTVTHVGIGVVRDKEVPGQVRGYYFTQLFAKPVAKMTLEQAREAVLGKVAQSRKKAGLQPLPMNPVLEKFAKEHVGRVDARAPGRTLGEIGDSAVKMLSKERGLNLRSVEAGAQAALGADLFRPEDMLDPSVRAVGFAIATGTDERGKPMLTMLMLVGR